jgi:hypothetical protein
LWRRAGEDYHGVATTVPRVVFIRRERHPHNSKTEGRERLE